MSKLCVAPVIVVAQPAGDTSAPEPPSILIDDGYSAALAVKFVASAICSAVGRAPPSPPTIPTSVAPSASDFPVDSCLPAASSIRCLRSSSFSPDLSGIAVGVPFFQTLSIGLPSLVGHGTSRSGFARRFLRERPAPLPLSGTTPFVPASPPTTGAVLSPPPPMPVPSRPAPVPPSAGSGAVCDCAMSFSTRESWLLAHFGTSFGTSLGASSVMPDFTGIMAPSLAALFRGA
jgi:hypothetical protein